MKTLCRYGTNRVIHPQGVLPQAASKIDNTMTIYDNELLIKVDTLNIDSASFTQIKQACNANISQMKTMILKIVNDRGKMQNPVTGSGGMLLGYVKEVGKKFPSQPQLNTKIATLVSLSLTPLHIEEIIDINLETDQVKIKGEAILFESGIYTEIPTIMNERVALAALDVAGAPAQVAKLVNQGDTVVIIGAAGKSGILCAYQARKSVGDTGCVIAVVNEPSQITFLENHDICDHIVLADATNAMEVYDKVTNVASTLADVTINVVNVDNTEMGSILITKDDGTVYFFSMATSFTKAALGAEGVKKDVKMLIGNGYTKNHANFTLDLVQNTPRIKQLFEEKYI
ncbi:MAG: L-erythro-3,5-diaminohexanoate dehydrogenase [Candidatus Izimaplasma sp.]|nr:L-erythro-3,5-diaminohexanoate dehydrogenase [Candidatus Izimaplasma bacterium]